MEIRITGTPNECIAAAAIIGAVLDLTAEAATWRKSDGVVSVFFAAQVLAEPDRRIDRKGQPS